MSTEPPWHEACVSTRYGITTKFVSFAPCSRFSYRVRIPSIGSIIDRPIFFIADNAALA
jgi:hypothetical protein